MVLLGLLAVRTPAREDDGATGLCLAASLLVFCLCHTQGFPNYYYLALFLLLLGVAQSGAPDCGAPVVRSATADGPGPPDTPQLA